MRYPVTDPKTHRLRNFSAVWGSKRGARPHLKSQPNLPWNRAKLGDKGPTVDAVNKEFGTRERKCEEL
jgi:hypothetical protein